jgi:hypothetical protein
MLEADQDRRKRPFAEIYLMTDRWSLSRRNPSEKGPVLRSLGEIAVMEFAVDSAPADGVHFDLPRTVVHARFCLLNPMRRRTFSGLARG